ncbi:hypothetical protein EJB05_35935, partial [Eragrostis curvula]
MQLPLRRALCSAVIHAHAGPVPLPPSTPTRPPWAMVYQATLLRSSAQRASFHPVAPPTVSHLLVPAHLVDPRPRPDRDIGIKLGAIGGVARATSGDGLLLLDFMDGRATDPVGGGKGAAARARILAGIDPDITRVVCNPLSGEMFRLPGMDGAKKAVPCQPLGLLTRSERPDGPPDRYAVAEISEGHGGEQRTFTMRRFLSQTGEWDELAGLPSPVPLARRLNIDEVLSFAGRLWWVDLSWGAVSADPFSDRPDLRFVELPSGSVTKSMDGQRVQGRYRRLGISEGKLRYFEVSRKDPFFLSSFSLDEGGSSWTQEHHVALNRCWKNHGKSSEEDTPQISTIDPLNASAIHITIGNGGIALSIDLGEEKVFWGGDGAGLALLFSGFLPCVLPPWLEATRIPCAGLSKIN